MRGSTQRESLATQKLDIILCAQKLQSLKLKLKDPKKGSSAFLGCIYCKSYQKYMLGDFCGILGNLGDFWGTLGDLRGLCTSLGDFYGATQSFIYTSHWIPGI